MDWIQSFYMDPGASGSYSGCMLVLTLPQYDKMPEAISFSVGTVYHGTWFQRFQSTVV